MSGPGGVARVGAWLLGAWLLAVTPSPAMPGRDEVEMVPVPAGEFVMGADDADADDDERLTGRVFVGAFQIDRVEVTNARYPRCVAAGPARSRPVPGSTTPRGRSTPWPSSAGGRR